MKKLIALLLVGAASVATAQDTSAFRMKGRISLMPQAIDNATNSSKLSEYRDLQDTRFPLFFDLQGTRGTRYFVDAHGSNITKKDQRISVSAGRWGGWRVDLGWNELPHNRSNKAATPYAYNGSGLLDAAQVIPITFKRLNTVAADAPQVVRMDTLIGQYVQANARPIDLGTRTKAGSAALRYNGIKGVDVSVGYNRRAKSGNKVGYGPIGDRPPRTLNVELAEPVNYLTNDVKAAAEYDGGMYQLRAEFQVTQFANDADKLVWRNLYATPTTAGGTTETWDRLVSVYGQRALPPDNSYQNTTLQGGLNLPFDSRLTLSAAFGAMTQNETLLPYSYATMNANVLPRATADARMNTLHYTAEYTVTPLKQLNLRGFYRLFDLDNETPASNFQYVTQDVANTNGTVSFKNKRVSQAFEYDRRNIGFDGSYRLPSLKSTIGVGYEHEQTERAFREAATWENIWRANWRLQPFNWFSLRTRFSTGTREGTPYNGNINRGSYWYAPSEAGTDNDNPAYTFTNHPDMRRYDVSMRKRNQLHMVAGLTPMGGRLSLSATFRHQNDDYDADVTSTQPLRGRALADSLAATPGDQLGLLERKQRQLGLDAAYLFSERITLNAGVGMDLGTSFMRSIEFNENNKQNPSTINTAELGPWTRGSSQWTTDFDDRTQYGTIGGTFEVTPKVNLAANYTLSLSNLDVEYAGFGVTNYDGTPFPANHQFGFQTPPAVKQNFQTADVQVDVALKSNVSLRVGYVFDTYDIADWQQEAATPMYEQVITDLLLRDTSRSHQWGNRYLNMGPMLAPKYTANIVQVGLTYSF